MASASRLAYIFPTTNAPEPSGKMEDLRSFLSDRDNPQGEGPARSKIRERLGVQRVLAMQQVSEWDVWIVTEE